MEDLNKSAEQFVKKMIDIVCRAGGKFTKDVEDQCGLNPRFRRLQKLLQKLKEYIQPKQQEISKEVSLLPLFSFPISIPKVENFTFSDVSFLTLLDHRILVGFTDNRDTLYAKDVHSGIKSSTYRKLWYYGYRFPLYVFISDGEELLFIHKKEDAEVKEDEVEEFSFEEFRILVEKMFANFFFAELERSYKGYRAELELIQQFIEDFDQLMNKYHPKAHDAYKESERKRKRKRPRKQPLLQ